MIGKRECVGRYDSKSKKDTLISDFPRMLTKSIQITGNHAARQNPQVQNSDSMPSAFERY